MHRYSPLTRKEGMPMTSPAKAATNPAQGNASQKEKSKRVRWNLGDKTDFYILFSKNGFTQKLLDLAKDKSQRLFLVSGIKLVKSNPR